MAYLDYEPVSRLVNGEWGQLFQCDNFPHFWTVGIFWVESYMDIGKLQGKDPDKQIKHNH